MWRRDFEDKDSERGTGIEIERGKEGWREKGSE